MTKNLNLKQTAAFIKEHDNYIVFTHASPDGDTIGSAFAFRYIAELLGKKAKVVCSDKIPEKFGYFMTQNEEVIPQTVVCIDVADLKLTGKFKDELESNVDLCIDHHITNKSYAKNSLVVPEAAACCEIMLSIAEELGVSISGKLADAIYTGICTDTGCFKFSNVTANTHLAAARLFGYGANVSEINRLMFDTKRKEQLALEKAALETLEYHFDNRCAIITITEEMLESSGCFQSELDAITAVPRSILGVTAGITIKQKEKDLYKISVRSKHPINASKVCALLGGGGHDYAAGCSVRGTAKQAKQKILEALKNFME